MTTRQWDGALLKQARLRKGWSQDELAREARTSVTNISRWERNRNIPSGNFLPVLAHVLGTDEGSFFHVNGSDPSDDPEEADLLGALLSLLRAELARKKAAA